MTNLPTAIHTAAQVRQIERDAIERLGIPGYTLMCRAGAAAWRALANRWPHSRRVAVVCGTGNNGGDGYVVARLARNAGLRVDVISLFDVGELKGDALLAYQAFAATGGCAIEWSDSVIQNADVIVDAIFGTGLSRDLDERLRAYVKAMNAARAPILALDVPSGIEADTGQVLGAAIKADCTITFIAPKIGFYVGAAADYVGAIEFDALDIEPSESSVEVAASRITEEWLRSALPRRSRLSHKGANGRVLVVGGGIGMAGAIRLAGEACLRVGAGLVTVATRSENVVSVVTERPELIVRAVESTTDIKLLIEHADVIAIGPGMGQDAWAHMLLDAVAASGRPMVVDADALNLLALRPHKSNTWILTPHPGEAGRLLGQSSAEIQSDRLGAARNLIDRYGGIAVLKGANTLVSRAGEVPTICDRGNPAMATPGMGDVLTGVVAGLFAQIHDGWIAARASVIAHAIAGELASAQLGNVERGLIASDLLTHLPACVSIHD